MLVMAGSVNNLSFTIKATIEIRKLSAEKHQLELEMEKLLEANVELATESKKLLGM